MVCPHLQGRSLSLTLFVFQLEDLIDLNLNGCQGDAAGALCLVAFTWAIFIYTYIIPVLFVYMVWGLKLCCSVYDPLTIYRIWRAVYHVTTTIHGIITMLIVKEVVNSEVSHHNRRFAVLLFNSINTRCKMTKRSHALTPNFLEGIWFFTVHCSVEGGHMDVNHHWEEQGDGVHWLS